MPSLNLMKEKVLLLLLLFIITPSLSAQDDSFVSMNPQSITKKDDSTIIKFCIKNKTPYYVYLDKRYVIERFEFESDAWVDIGACKDVQDIGIILTPYHQIEMMAYTFCLKSGKYRFFKNVEYDNKTHFISFEFVVF